MSISRAEADDMAWYENHQAEEVTLVCTNPNCGAIRREGEGTDEVEVTYQAWHITVYCSSGSSMAGPAEWQSRGEDCCPTCGWEGVTEEEAEKEIPDGWWEIM
jgi:hypothetical protein